ncbi:50S ribosomal protein L25/general stress protein Ctc [Microseira sp. BLCC-F43]|jgi:large subunit ribosomal protein L25|uniref:50S ribosomal protein L25/general stress protein Ctc n=1 Tax=Microseira sp. BLCC-F43 TaxID=3153602 RepID=UPI0035BAF516
MELTVESKKREAGTKPNALRRSGLIPAVLYGHKGVESVALTVDAKVAERLLEKASVNNTVIDLNVADMGWSGKTLLREVQIHPWKRFPYHLSFFAIAAHGPIDVEVRLHFVGEATGVKNSGGVLDTVITQLQVRCAPDKIVDSIEINVSTLEVGSSLYVRDIILPEGVTALTDGEQTVVTVVAPRSSDEDKATAAES